MGAMTALGREFVIIPVAAGQFFQLTAFQAVAFCCVGEDVYTLKNAKSAAGLDAAALGVITNVYTQSAQNGTEQYVSATQAASATLSVGSGACAVFETFAADLSAGFDYVGVVPAGDGLVIAVVHSPQLERAPWLLPALAV